MKNTTDKPASLTYSPGFYAVGFVDERVRYLNHLRRSGWAIKTLRVVAQRITALAARIDITAADGVTFSQIEAAADDWMQTSRGKFRSELGPSISRAIFVSYSKRWLKFLGVFQEEQQSSSGPYSELLSEYRRFLEQEKGLAAGSVRTHNSRLVRFVSWLDENHVSLENLTLKEVQLFLATSSDRPYARQTIANSATTIRGFLRYAEVRKHCPPNIAEAIEAPRIYSQSTLPAGPSWTQVRTLISKIGLTEPKDIRDRAVIMLLAIYGFRAGEVCTLHLEALNWDQELIRVSRSKISDQQLYPLIPEVGDAILLYLQKARPQTHRREVFLRTLPPFEPLTPGGFSQMVSKRLHALNLNLPHYGCHALRHACATHLLSEGLSFKEIGDHLGHLDPESTRIYAKVDLNALREVARFDLGDLI